MIDVLRAFLLVALGLPLHAIGDVRVEPSVTLTRESIDLEAGALVTYAYELAAGSELTFRVDLLRWQHEPLRMWLVDAPNYRLLAAGRPFDFIEQGTGRIERAGQVVVPVRHSLRYFVVLDNTQSDSDKAADVYAYATTPVAEAPEAHIERLYEGYYAALDTLFDMEGITIDVRRCGSPNAYAVETRIVICRELHDMLTAENSPGALFFVVLHEASHSLISRWGHGWINSNQIMIDRLAATLFRILDGGELTRHTAAWLRASATREPGQLAFSGVRARRIAAWLEQDEELRRRWARRVVVPRMRTAALETLLAAHTLSDSTRDVIGRELAERGVGATPRSP